MVSIMIYETLLKRNGYIRLSKEYIRSNQTYEPLSISVNVGWPCWLYYHDVGNGWLCRELWIKNTDMIFDDRRINYD